MMPHYAFLTANLNQVVMGGWWIADNKLGDHGNRAHLHDHLHHLVLSGVLAQDPQDLPNVLAGYHLPSLQQQ